MNSTSLIVPRDGIDLSAGTCCVSENEIEFLSGRTCCPESSSATPHAPSVPWRVAEVINHLSSPMCFVCD